MVAIPEGYESLLERPLFGHLATVRPDGSPQVNAMWFDWTANGCASPTPPSGRRSQYCGKPAGIDVGHRSR